MNPRTRRAALHAIAAIAVLASLNALAHSYAGLYQWAIHHRMSGWQAFTWPAEIDVFLIIGELALYVAYLDAWTTRHKIWPWATALLGLAVSVAGNIGHLPAVAGAQVSAVDRLTAGTSPVAAFAGLAIALLVLKQTRPDPTCRSSWRQTAYRTYVTSRAPGSSPESAHFQTRPGRFRTSAQVASSHQVVLRSRSVRAELQSSGEPSVLLDARKIRAEYERRGIGLSRRQLARQLRARGHTLSNARIPDVAAAIGLS